jgi:hypothetical protein
MPEMEEMLGIIPIGAISTPQVEQGTILDNNHDFWNEYHKSINTDNAVRIEIRQAMESLRDDGILQISTIEGDSDEEWDKLYVEVEDISSDNPLSLSTTCRKCSGGITTTANLQNSSMSYRLTFTIDCPNCEFETTVGEPLERVE